MGVRHKSLLIEGVQFHPESILTEHGHDLLQSFVDTCAQSDSSPSAQTTQAPAKLMEDSR
jgi:hypothetical protein